MLKLVSSEPLEFNLEEMIRAGVQRMLAQALDVEVADYISKFQDQIDENGHKLVVRNGKSKSRKVTTTVGTVELQAPRVNDRRSGEKFTSSILPPYLRSSPKVESLIPVLYLKGISTGKISEALRDYFGDSSMGLSAASVSKLLKAWEQEFKQFKRRKIESKFIYIWADGVNVKIRLGDDKKICLLVIVGVREDGSKELIAVQDGYRESKEAWLCLLRDLVSRGFRAPMLAIGDGALGFWSAIRELEEFRQTKEQRCWVHKIANVLNKLPKRVQPEAKSLLHEMMKAPDRESAEEAMSIFKRTFEDRYDKAVDCLVKDWQQLTTFFNFPAQHWISLRTTNPIESSFSTVKLRTKSTRGAGSPKTAVTLAFKLLRESEKKWRKIKGHKEIPKLLAGVVFKDGVVVPSQQENHEASAG
mgnify:CR=1 FL=1